MYDAAITDSGLLKGREVMFNYDFPVCKQESGGQLTVSNTLLASRPRSWGQAW